MKSLKLYTVFCLLTLTIRTKFLEINSKFLEPIEKEANNE